MKSGADARQVRSEQDTRQALEVRACEIGTLIMTMESGKAADAMQAMLDNSTGSFRAGLESSRTELTELMDQARTTSRVNETQCFYKSGDEHTAEVLFTGNRTTTNATVPTPQTAYATMTMTLEKVDDRWLCSKAVLPKA